MTELATVEQRLAPLLELLRQRVSRVVARPGWVSLDRPDGPQRIEVAWDENTHHAALAAMGPGPVALSGGVVAAALSGALLLRRPPDAVRRVDDVIQDGGLSALCGRLLSAALGTGRNVALVGPFAACVDLGAALLAEGERPVVLGGPEAPAPLTWPKFGSAAEARAWGADRLALWELSPVGAAAALCEANGAVAWIDARQLSRALIRFEALEGTPVGAMRVVGGLDLVVLVGQKPSVRVREVVELVLSDEGYRPQLLFASGRPPAPAALVPVGLPTFVEELRGVDAVLADELQHAVGDAVAAAPLSEASPPAPARRARAARSTAVGHAPRAAPEPTVEPPRGPRPSLVPPRIEPASDDSPDPGWELDELGDDGIDQDLAASNDPDAAVLAASFGLGPPPRPQGIVGGPLGAGAGSNFADALDRARRRDAELRRSLEQDDPLEFSAGGASPLSENAPSGEPSDEE